MSAPLRGLLDLFTNLDEIKAEDVLLWIKPVPQAITLENYLANKILYPYTIPITEYEMQIELGILREALKMSAPKQGTALLGNNPFINTTLRKILIPQTFLNHFPNLQTLALVFIDAFLTEREKKDFFTDLWSIVLTDDTDEVVGSLILPEFKNSGTININVLGRSYQIKQGSLGIIPCPRERCEIIYKTKNGTLLGKSENAVEVAGGKLGLLVDGRQK